MTEKVNTAIQRMDFVMQNVETAMQMMGFAMQKVKNGMKRLEAVRTNSLACPAEED